jgi:hypothetical protein
LDKGFNEVWINEEANEVGSLPAWDHRDEPGGGLRQLRQTLSEEKVSVLRATWWTGSGRSLAAFEYLSIANISAQRSIERCRDWSAILKIETPCVAAPVKNPDRSQPFGLPQPL